MVKNLVPLIPAHEIYVEVFGGGAALFFAKEPSPVEVYNDLDSGLVTFFRVLRDRDKFAHFFVRCCATPYSREEYRRFLETWQEPDDDCERAYRWFVVARSSFAGIWGNSWGSTVTKSARGMAGTAIPAGLVTGASEHSEHSYARWLSIRKTSRIRCESSAQTVG